MWNSRPRWWLHMAEQQISGCRPRWWLHMAEQQISGCYLFLSATTYLLFCHVQPPPRSAVPHVCCRPSNGRKMQALTAVEWLTAVRYETDGRLANGWTDGLPENRLTGLGAGLPLTISISLQYASARYS